MVKLFNTKLRISADGIVEYNSQQSLYLFNNLSLSN